MSTNEENPRVTHVQPDPSEPPDADRREADIEREADELDPRRSVERHERADSDDAA